MNDYKLYFWCIVCFLVGYFLRDFKLYIGPDEAKYAEATLGILLKQ